MRLLVDANALLWAVDDPAQLSAVVTAALQDPHNQLVLSAATLWEIAIKVGIGKLTISMPYRTWIDQAVADLGMAVLPITVAYADAQVGLPMHHRDPFDRILVAQALVERLPIVSSDSTLDRYGFTRVWE